jgi:4-amino-4-deoxy-L-arabinose transferase-like glycosyltransferase
MARKIKKSKKTTKKKPLGVRLAYLKHSFWVFFAAVIVFSVFYTFDGLGSAPVFDWDEARHGISAYEMLKSGNFVAQTYLGELDYWNLKPPLSFWTIAAAYRIFGVNAFALRFFSALCLPVIIAVFMLFFRKYGSAVFALIGGLFFTLVGVRMNHLFLSGDADALFFLFMFLAMIFFIQAMCKGERYLAGVGICTAFALLAKATHIIIIALVVAIGLILLRKVKLFSVKQLTLYGAVPFFATALPWVIWRLSFDGIHFFREMILVDVISRMSPEGIEGNARGGWYYIDELIRVLGMPVFVVFMLTLAVCMALFVFARLENRDKVIVAAGSLTALVPLILYSSISTKLGWYVWPSVIGFIMLLTWLCGYLFSLKKDQWYAVAAVIVIITAVSCAYLPDKEFHRYYYDENSMLPVLCVFYDLPYGNGSLYNVISPDGSRGVIPQSWVLAGIFNGYEQTADPDNAVLTLVVHGRHEITILQ